ncbi:KpsF/GutQ family sugar-phosphate isomerase [Niveispirillum cyanobacteriorum]|uniref:KpsF/GutQ family sugar-phosphate isomerase n=1 Tax=Niveispirillum cyanobacteriorum TaxID=1612173 RepID=A0A2K9NG47_9PROT|nr:SIS domain-containing protein [Niveispirillum cyanobacteriorum]AUN32057.1 KpsF/GutQ family sugar-phosphate isomerase [Niveispirillum cyanobacteriorum]GGE73815.1 KpsF/GutQ [Niveispirillum cyanobacteriorum]
MTHRDDPALMAAADLLRIEAKAVLAQLDSLDADFLATVSHIASGAGNTLVAGVGKSGLIARLLSSKLASVGAQAFYYSALDALHGELGALREGDLVILLSNSGQTQELIDLAKVASRRGVKVAAMVSRVPSGLTRIADWTLRCHVEREATETKLPTASTTAMLALGDALVVAVAKRRGFTIADYGDNHPGGTLGIVLAGKVRDLMVTAPEQAALVTGEQPIFETLLAMTRFPNGAALVVDGEGRLTGIVTEGDIRRGLAAHGKAFLERDTGACMTSPVRRTCGPDATALEALEIMETPHQINVLPVVDGDGLPLGLLRLHDIAGLEVEKSLG